MESPQTEIPPETWWQRLLTWVFQIAAGFFLTYLNAAFFIIIAQQLDSMLLWIPILMIPVVQIAAIIWARRRGYHHFAVALCLPLVVAALIAVAIYFLCGSMH